MRHLVQLFICLSVRERDVEELYASLYTNSEMCTREFVFVFKHMCACNNGKCV